LRFVEDSDLGWESDCNSRSCNVYHLYRDFENAREIGLATQIDSCSWCGADGQAMGFV
jgi:hypothetical protein